MRSRIALLSVLICCAASELAAQTAAQPNAAAVLRPGMDVWITDRSARETRIRIVSVASPVVTAIVDGAPRQLDVDEITRVRERRSDSVLNGALIGAGVSVALGVSLCRLMEPWDVCNDPGPITRLAAVGAAAGVGIDALFRGRRTIYEAPDRARLDVSPLAWGSGSGVRVSVRF